MKKWYREVWPWALMLPPLLAVVGGVTMVILAVRTPSALVVADYARIEDLTRERFERDREAARRGIAASIQFSAERIDLTLDAAGAEQQELILLLQHATDAALDREFRLIRSTGAFMIEAEILPGRYRLELMPPDRSWRLASDILRPAGPVVLLPQESGS